MYHVNHGKKNYSRCLKTTDIILILYLLVNVIRYGLVGQHITETVGTAAISFK